MDRPDEVCLEPESFDLEVVIDGPLVVYGSVIDDAEPGRSDGGSRWICERTDAGRAGLRSRAGAPAAPPSLAAN